MNSLLRIFFFLAGTSLVFYTINSALRSFVLPRADSSYLTRFVIKLINSILSLAFKPSTRYSKRDYILAMHPPYTMFVLPIVWLANIIIGYTGIYWALDPTLSVYDAIVLSGSSLMTLGASFHDYMPIVLLTFSQAALSMMLIALLIGYLPTMYGAFSEREKMVTKMETFAGSPPSPVEMVRRLHYVQMLDNAEFMMSFWTDWSDWFIQIEEQHTSLALLNYYRSPQPDRHWVITAGCLMDAASIIASSVQVERATLSGSAVRAGFLSLHSIADSFNLTYNKQPKPDDPIQITRAEFEAALNELEHFGVPINPDRDYCWDHYQGWRVNYDEVLIRLAWITNAPYAMWSSDRAFDWLPEDIPADAPSMLEAIRTQQT
ncbi:MAG: hypothetical protein AAFQ52_09950 [Chloroflexota bacterium]